MNAESNIFSDHPEPTEEQLKQGIEVYDERFRSLVHKSANNLETAPRLGKTLSRLFRRVKRRLFRG